MKTEFDIRYDRSVTAGFLSHFLRGGVAASLTEISKKALYPLDLQMRKSPKTGAEHASLYTGLTSVLNVHRTSAGFRLSGHATWTRDRKLGFDRRWETSQSLDQWRHWWPSVELYLERAIPVATRSHGLTEGAVQAAVSSGRDRKRLMLDREVVPSFRNAAYKKKIMQECMRPIVSTLAKGDFHAGRVPMRFGAECDLLAVEPSGRLLAVEVKPLAGGSIAWVAAQAAMYARVLQRWIDVDGEEPRRVLQAMLAQRQSLGLCPAVEVDLPTELIVTPVVALQRGASDKSRSRMLAVRDALTEREDLGVPPVQIFEVSITGALKELT